MTLSWKFAAPYLNIFTSVFTLSNLEINQDLELFCSLQMERIPGKRKTAYNKEKSLKSFESEEGQETYKTQKSQKTLPIAQ